MLTFRELPSDEWPRLLDHEPFKTSGLPVDNGHWKILVAELEGQIVGCSGVHEQVHWDPWWIAPDHRGNAGVVRGLVRYGAEFLLGYEIPQVFCTIDDARVLSHDLAQRLGFEPAPGRLYILDLTALGLEEAS